MDLGIIELKINSLVGRDQRHEFELFSGEHNSQIVLLIETRLHYRHKPSFPNFNLFLSIDLTQTLTSLAEGTAILVSDKFFTTRATIVSLEIVSVNCLKRTFGPNDFSIISSFCAGQLRPSGKLWSLICGGRLNIRHTSWCDSYNTTSPVARNISYSSPALPPYIQHEELLP